MLTLTNQFSYSCDSDLDIPAQYEIQQRSSLRLFDGFLSDSSDDDAENRYRMAFAIDYAPTNEHTTFNLIGHLVIANHIKSLVVDETSPVCSQNSQSRDIIRGYFYRLVEFFSSSSSSPNMSDRLVDDLSFTKEFTSPDRFKPTPKPLQERSSNRVAKHTLFTAYLGRAALARWSTPCSATGNRSRLKSTIRISFLFSPLLNT